MEDKLFNENPALSLDLNQIGERGLPRAEPRSFSHIHSFIVNSSTVMSFPETQKVKNFSQRSLVVKTYPQTSSPHSSQSL